MSKATRDDERFERLLSEVRLAEASQELKARVTGAAANAWQETSVEISWRIPLRRMAISAAAAVVIVSLANYVSGEMTTVRQGRDVLATAKESGNFDTLAEELEGSLVRRLVATGRRPGVDISQVRNRIEKVQRMLGEDQVDGKPERPPAIEGRSRRGGVSLRSFS